MELDAFTLVAATRRLTEQDPAVRAGRMSVEAMTWLARKGTFD